MNLFIETLNHWGGNFLDFAGTMLWQSSLLIVILFAADFLFRRKIRASIRYSLWLVVLLKLVLPPTLALPTSPVWWLYRTPSVQTKPRFQNYTVIYDSQPLPEIPENLPAFTPPKPKLTISARLLVISISVSVTLFLWLLARWWQIARQARRAEISERLMALANEVRQFAGIKSNPPVKLTANTMSPAVCGLFRPVILIPQSLAENFSNGQLRAVLLHELIHLRRRDVWLNFLQSLLQIFYWWQPLVWLANARIRRVREEAVDDAVMLALRDEAESYAPTLLEVAKLALNRPLASLGLVGILESRSALRQRIERLVNFSAPRKAGLTFLSFCGIFLFSAAALPMGAGPNSNDQSNLPKISPAPKKVPVKQVLITSHFYWMGNGRAEKVMSDLKLNFSANDPSWLISAQKFNQVADGLRSSSFSEFAAPRVVTINHETATVSVSKGTNGIYVTCTPIVTNNFVSLVIHGTVNEDSIRDQFNADSILESRGGILIHAKNDFAESNLVVLVGVQIIDPTNFAKKMLPRNEEQLVQDGKLLYEMGKLDEAKTKFKAALALDAENAAAKYYLGLVQSARQFPRTIQTSPGRKNIVEKLDYIRLPQVGFEQLSLAEVVRQLNEMARQNDPEKTGVNIFTATNSVSGRLADINSVVINLPSPLKNARLADVLDAVVEIADKPIEYSILDDGIAFSLHSEILTLYSRVFRVDTLVFTGALRKQAGLQTNNVSTMARSFFSKLGVDLDLPGKAVFYNDGLGELFVRGTEQDLDTIENAVEILNRVAPQIHIKARFFEVPKGTLADLGDFLNSTNSAADTFTGILNGSNAKIVLRSLESRKGIITLAEPEVVTTSGRQTQMRATRIITVITNFGFQESISNGTTEIFPQMNQVEAGPVLDVIPYVLSDGYTINLTIIPSVTEFFGYATPPQIPNVTGTNNRVQLPVILPQFSVRTITASLNLWDGQTVIVGGMAETNYTMSKVPVLGHVPLIGRLFQSKIATENEILVFITATIVDPAGNRVHAEDELPFAQKEIPPQPSQPK